MNTLYEIILIYVANIMNIMTIYIVSKLSFYSKTEPIKYCSICSVSKKHKIGHNTASILFLRTNQALACSLNK